MDVRMHVSVKKLPLTTLEADQSSFVSIPTLVLRSRTHDGQGASTCEIVEEPLMCSFICAIARKEAGRMFLFAKRTSAAIYNRTIGGSAAHVVR
jgi:hypothetical protein